MRYQFIRDQQRVYPVRRLCQTMQVSASGYYAWCSRVASARQQANAGLRPVIEGIHARSRGTYGRYRVQAELKGQGYRCGHNRVGRLMRQWDLQGRRRGTSRPRTTHSRHAWPVAPNLLDRHFAATRPNEKWLNDITFIPTQEGWLYLAVVLDTYARTIVGWSMQERLTTALPLAALKSALAARRPTQPLLHHSDRGSQYASAHYQSVLKAHALLGSMSRPGNCYDNAMLESFFATLKSELPVTVFASRAEARTAIFDFIEVWYNRQRRHSALGYLSPFDFEHLFPS